MAGKTHGKGAAILAGGYDLSGSTSSLDTDDQLEVSDITTFGSTAKSFLAGLFVGKLTQKTFFDDTAAGIYTMVKAVRGLATTVATFAMAGASVQGNSCLNAVAELLTNAKINSPVAGAVTLQADWQATGGFEYGTILQPESSITGTGAQQVSAVVDNTVSSAKGASAYFHITTIAGGATVSPYKVQHSADNTTWVDLLTSGQAGTAIGADRQATSSTTTINRYVRAAFTITNALAATLTVAFVRN